MNNQGQPAIVVVGGPDGFSKKQYQALGVSRLSLLEACSAESSLHEYSHVVYWPTPSFFNKYAKKDGPPDIVRILVDTMPLLRIPAAATCGAVHIVIIPKSILTWSTSSRFAHWWLGAAYKIEEGTDSKVLPVDELQKFTRSEQLLGFHRQMCTIVNDWPFRISVEGYIPSNDQPLRSWSTLLDTWTYYLKKGSKVLPEYIETLLKTEVKIIPGHVNACGEAKSLLFLSGKGCIVLMPEPQSLRKLVDALRPVLPNQQPDLSPGDSGQTPDQGMLVKKIEVLSQPKFISGQSLAGREIKVTYSNDEIVVAVMGHKTFLIFLAFVLAAQTAKTKEDTWVDVQTRKIRGKDASKWLPSTEHGGYSRPVQYVDDAFSKALKKNKVSHMKVTVIESAKQPREKKYHLATAYASKSLIDLGSLESTLKRKKEPTEEESDILSLFAFFK